MNPPKIFISATSGDLSSARQIAKEALLTINCHPVEQTNFEPDWRSVTDMLRGKISDCQALIHLVGFRYGAEPDPATLPGGTPRRSYTQMEYHLARELGLRVYTFLLPETYPFDVPGEADTPEQTQLQAAHRALIQSSPHLYEKPANGLDLRTRIIALQEQVISLEQEQQSIATEVKTTRHWGLWAAAAVLLILGGIGFWLNVISHKQDEQTKLVKDQSNLLREAVVQLEQLTEEKSKLGIKITDLPREAVEKELAARVGVSAVELRLNIEAGKKSQDALTRAHANLLAGKLADAHTAAKQVRDAEAPTIQRIIQSLQVDGQAYFQELKYEAALESCQKAAAMVDKTTDPIAWAEAQAWVTFILDNLARYRESEPLERDIVRIREQNLGSNHTETATALNNLAMLLKATNRFTEAEPLMRRALTVFESTYGKDHPNVAAALSNLAQLLQTTNHITEAEPLMRRALKIDEANFGLEHPNVAISLNNLALLLKATNRLTEAEPMYRRAVKILENQGGETMPNYAAALTNLAALLQATNRLTEAELTYRKALKADEANLGPDHPTVATELNNLAQLLHDSNRLEEAESLMQRALKIDEASYGSDHPDVATDLNNLARLFMATKRLTEAESLFRRALTIDEHSYGTDHPDVARDLNNLAQLLQVTNRHTEAEQLSRRQLKILVTFCRSTGYEHPNFRQAVENYHSLLTALKLPEDQINTKLRDVLGPQLAPTFLGPFVVTITEVIKGGQGESLGLQVGDVYLTYNGETITSVEQIVRLAGESKGEAIPLEVLRDGKKLTFTAKAGKLNARVENRPLRPATGAAPAK